MKKLIIIAFSIFIIIALTVFTTKEPAQMSPAGTATETEIAAQPEIVEKQVIPVPVYTPTQPTLSPLESFIKRVGIESEFDDYTQDLVAKLNDLIATKDLSDETTALVHLLISEMHDGSLLNQYKKRINETFSEQELTYLDTIYKDERIQKVMTEWSLQEKNLEQLEHDAAFFDSKNLPSERRETLKELVRSFVKGLDTDPLFASAEGGSSLYPGELFLKRFAMILEDQSIEDIRNLQSQFGDPVFIKERLERLAAFRPFEVIQETAHNDKSTFVIERTRRRKNPPKEGSFSVVIDER